METVWQFLKMFNIHPPYDSALPLLGIYSREKKAHIRTKTYTWMLIQYLFEVAKNWKQPKCPSIEEWTNKLDYVHTMEYLLVINRMNYWYSITMWMNLRINMLNEKSQKKKRVPNVWFHLHKTQKMQTNLYWQKPD